MLRLIPRVGAYNSRWLNARDLLSLGSAAGLMEEELGRQVRDATNEAASAFWIEARGLQEAAGVLEAAGKNGFEFHRAVGDRMQLLKWLGKGPSKVPAFASHTVGVGGVVLFGDLMLSMQEKQGPRKGKWKLPGGLVDLGESIENAVVREIQEETGIEKGAVQFDSLLGFREFASTSTSATNLYFVCGVNITISGKTSPPQVDLSKTDPEEVLATDWIPISVYESNIQDHPMHEWLMRLVNKHRLAKKESEWSASSMPGKAVARLFE